MKQIYSILYLLFLSFTSFTQSSNMTLLGTWNDTSISLSHYGQVYSDCWGWAQDGREYAVIGSTMGAHIIDVTNPSGLVEIDVVAGSYISNKADRDFKVHNGYLYMVCAEAPSSLQIIDLSYLPDSVHVVYDEDSLANRCHNIHIDTANELLFLCGISVPGSNIAGNSVVDISNPLSPTLLSNLNNDVSWWSQAISFVHDMYIKNNKAYVNHGNGISIVDFSDINNPILLGAMTSYPDQGYNHSGWLKDDDTTYIMLDETLGKRVKFLDVSTPSNMLVTDMIGTANNTDTNSIPHNGFLKGDLAFVSYYRDGIYAYDVSDRNNVILAGYYDTYLDTGVYEYNGAWGVYPYLPSGNIIVSDMQSGLMVFNLNYNVGVNDLGGRKEINIYPNPVVSGNEVNFDKTVNFEIYSLSGKSLSGKLKGDKFSTIEMTTGCYFVKVNNSYTKLIVK